MKKLLAMVLALCLLASCTAFAEEDGPLTPYAETVVINMMYEDDPNIPFWYGETIDENVVEAKFREVLNIDFQATWLVDTTQYASQLNNAIMTNNLPDMFVASKAQVATLQEYGQIEELSEVYEKYISDNARAVLEFQDKIAFGPVSIDGGVWALPLPNDFSDEITVMYIRKDWREKVGREVPTTVEELVDLAIAFATEDPDGNGIDDTYGIATDAGLHYLGELLGPVHGAYRDIWLENDEGELQYSSTYPEFKEMLKVINHLYHNGGISKEFAVHSVNSNANEVAEGKCGIYPCSFWAIYWMLNMSMNNEPEAQWEAYPILKNPETGEYNPRALDTSYRWLVVRKGFEHPEAAVKAINLWQEIWQGEYGDWFWSLMGSEEYDTDIKYYSPIFFDPPYKNIEKAQAVSDAIYNGDMSGLINSERQLMYDNWAKATGLMESDYSDKGKIIQKWVVETDIDAFLTLKNDYGMKFQYSDFNGPITTEITEAQSMAYQVYYSALVDMIMCDPAELDGLWDQYIADWKAAGGDDWTAAVNEWYAENKK